MGTEVANVAPNLGALAKGLKRTKQQMPSFGGKPYLKFGKDGEWSAGRGGDALNGDRAILNLNTLKSGYVCWTNYDAKDKKKNEKLGEEMALATQGSIDPGNLPDLGWEWKQQQSIEGRMLTGDRQEFVYNTSSMGGLEAMDKVIDAVMERLGAGEEVYVFPVVEMLDDWYEHAQWGKTYKPVLEIVGWADVDGAQEGERKAVTAAPEGDDGDQDEPDDRSDEASPEADEPPVRRRRRR